MIVTIFFGSEKEFKKDLDSKIDSIWPFIGCLEKEGVVFGEPILGVQKEDIVCITKCFAPFSLKETCISEYTISALNRIIEEFGQEPRFEFGSLPKKTSSKIVNPKSILLFTHFLDNCSPIVDPQTGKAIPMHHVKMVYQTKEGLLWWQEMYKSFDRQFMMGHDKIEMTAYKQIADPNSEFGKESRKLAKDIEEETGVPTYYFLMRHFAFDCGEKDLPCPVCSNEWLKKDDFKVKLKFVEWVCHSCRIMSSSGVSYDGKRKASIGVSKAFLENCKKAHAREK